MLQLLGSHKAKENWALKSKRKNDWQWVSQFLSTDVKNVPDAPGLLFQAVCRFRKSSALLPARSQLGQEKRANTWTEDLLSLQIKLLELRQKMTHLHFEESVEKEGDIFSSFILKGSEFHLHVLQMAKSGERSYCWAFSTCWTTHSQLLWLQRSSVLAKGCTRPLGRGSFHFTEGGKPEGALDGLVLEFFIRLFFIYFIFFFLYFASASNTANQKTDLPQPGFNIL